MRKLKNIHHVRFYKDKIVFVLNNKIAGAIGFNKEIGKDFNFQAEAMLNDIEKLNNKYDL